MIYYKTYGYKNKTPLIILHGWGGGISSWEKVANILSKKFYVIVPEIPCASKSILTIKKQDHSGLYDKIYTLNDYSKLIENLIKKLKLEDFVLLGHSNGGAIATKLVVNYKNLKIKKLILNNSAGIRKNIKTSFKIKIFGFISKYIKPIYGLPGMLKIRSLFYKAIGGHDYLNSEKKINIKQTYLNMINEDLQLIFTKIEIQTLLIWGENDTYTPLKNGKKIHSLIKKSKLIVIKNAKHGIHLQNPEKLTKIIIENI